MMYDNTSTNEMREWIDQRSKAVENIHHAFEKLRKIEGILRRQLGEHVGRFYENWSPKVGDVAVYIKLIDDHECATRVLVKQVRGKCIVFVEEDNDRARIHFDLEHYRDCFSEECDSERVELVVPAAAYDEEVRHWFGMRKETNQL